MKTRVYQQTQNKSVNDMLLVVRKILLPAMQTDTDVDNIVHLLTADDKIMEIHVNLDKQLLFVKYDVSQIEYSQLLIILDDAAYPTQRGLLATLKTAWYEFIENNKRDNANAPPPACCNKPPK